MITTPIATRIITATTAAPIAATTAPVVDRQTTGGRPASRFRRVDRPIECQAPNDAARRIGVAASAVVALVVAAFLLDGLLASFGGRPASAAEAVPAAAEAVSVSTYVAADGDTLWSIASDHRGSVGHERYVEALIRLNGATTILVGQMVVLP